MLVGAGRRLFITWFRFSYCSSCDKLYWKGNQVANIIAKLETLSPLAGGGQGGG